MEKYYLWQDPVGWGLILYSVAALGLIIERVLAYMKTKGQTKKIAREVEGMIQDPNRESMEKAFTGSPAPLGAVMTYVLKHGISGSPETTLLLIDDALENTLTRLKKNLTFIAAIAGTAPFLGLLGTVLGIMNTFKSIMGAGISPAIISAGIAQALQTTAVGLVIAIPAFVAYTIFSAKVNNMANAVKREAHRLFVALGEL